MVGGGVHTPSPPTDSHIYFNREVFMTFLLSGSMNVTGIYITVPAQECGKSSVVFVRCI